VGPGAPPLDLAACLCCPGESVSEDALLPDYWQVIYLLISFAQNKKKSEISVQQRRRNSKMWLTMADF